jgi:hypothetical protein
MEIPLSSHPRCTKLYEIFRQKALREDRTIARKERSLAAFVPDRPAGNGEAGTFSLKSQDGSRTITVERVARIEEFNFENSDDSVNLIHQVNEADLKHSGFTPKLVEAIQLNPFPFAPKSVITTGGEKIVMSLGDGRILKISARPPKELRSFDVPILQKGELSHQSEHVFFWTEPHLDPATLEEIVQFEKEVLLPKNYGIRDFRLNQFGRDENGKIYLLDQGAVTAFRTSPPQAARQFQEYSQLLKKLQKTKAPAEGPELDKFIATQKLEVERISRLAADIESYPAADLRDRIEILLRNWNYPR